MTNKTMILGLIIIVLIVGAFWFFNNFDLSVTKQTASVLEPEGDQIKDSGQIKVIEGEIILGNPDAKVTMVEYSNHFCGHCADFHKDTLPLILDKYIKTGKIRFIPRRLSPSELGEALFCAQEQGEFWQIDEYLFKHSQGLIEATDQIESAEEIEGAVSDWLKKAAGDLGLNQDDFGQCLELGKYEELVGFWFDQANADNIQGTPSFLVNDQEITGNQPYEKFEEVIEGELE